MKLYEHQAKGILAQWGIPIPKGKLVQTPAEAAKAVAELGPAVLKAQVLTGGRGKAGGIRPAATPEETAQVAEAILGMEIKGLRVDSVLVEEQLTIREELYLGISLDRGARGAVILASRSGGMDIETVPVEKIIRLPWDPGKEFYPHQGREMALRLGLSGTVLVAFGETVAALAKVFQAWDAELTEINPLVLTDAGLVAADARLNVDDSALFRHPELAVDRHADPLEREAKNLGLSFIRLDGDIAVLANGAGMAMATLDVLDSFGGRAASFMDLGGGTGEEAMAGAIGLLAGLSPRAMLVNIFGGITRCDEVARALVRARAAASFPLVVRLSGTNQAQGLEILRSAGIEAVATMEEAARLAVQGRNGQ